MTDQQTVEALRIETERLWQIEIEARRVAAMKEREYRKALWEALEGLTIEYDRLAEVKMKGEG